MTNDEILNIKLVDCGGAKTIRQYFAFIASEVLTQVEWFSGKYGIGGSDWQTDIYTALIKAGAIDGEIDDDGFITECDYDEADLILKEAIESMGVEVRAEPKRKMVVFESVDGDAVAIDPSQVGAMLFIGGMTRVFIKGIGVNVKETLASVALSLGFDIVESIECKQQ